VTPRRYRAGTMPGLGDARAAPATPTPDPLRPAQDRFIQLWGEMGSNWGIPRSMAEVHALLFIVGRPMNTDEVMERLGVSRGNASMTVRALVDWGIVARAHVRGDRKEYFHAEQDVWKLFRTILRERKKREIDPLLESLRACRAMTERGGRRIDAGASALAAHHRRLDDLLAFLHLVNTISERFISPSGQGLEKAARVLARGS
jgi:DNA-binding transcriptional regulator GbsR (MarR family)